LTFAAPSAVAGFVALPSLRLGAGFFTARLGRVAMSGV
jgi:hypothetical protein